jgi:SAM-dependent methyltransferase
MDILTASKEYYWYHCVELAPGIVTEGDHEMAEYLPAFHFPERMDGLQVLDVGRASGYFAFEFEKRGAAVTATELPSIMDWDFVGGDLAREERRKGIADVESFNLKYIYGAFEFARRARRSKVTSKSIRAYDLRPEAFGGQKFDLVFAGSITSHLRDPIGALERVYSVTKDLAIISAPVFDLHAGTDQPLMKLVGTFDADRRSWWNVNERGLHEILYCAGFRTVTTVGKFDLCNRRDPRGNSSHVVVHARI